MKFMRMRIRFLSLAIFSMALLPARRAFADDLNQVLQSLNAAAKNFHTTSANVEFDTITTDPIPDSDVQTGAAYYERKGNSFEMSAHFHTHNDGPSQKTYIFSGGVLRISDTGKESDAKAYSQARKYESYLMLGFGASGKDLEDKWNITYLGTENIGGVKTDKLELVAKDPDVRKNIPEVTVWMDTPRAVSLKVVFDEGEGTKRVCTYTNIKVNQPLPSDAFKFTGGK
jgi:outer membrane lipoprotein-sorting protein